MPLHGYPPMIISQVGAVCSLLWTLHTIVHAEPSWRKLYDPDDPLNDVDVAINGDLIGLERLRNRPTQIQHGNVDYGYTTDLRRYNIIPRSPVVSEGFAIINSPSSRTIPTARPPNAPLNYVPQPSLTPAQTPIQRPVQTPIQPPAQMPIQPAVQTPAQIPAQPLYNIFASPTTTPTSTSTTGLADVSGESSSTIASSEDAEEADVVEVFSSDQLMSTNFEDLLEEDEVLADLGVTTQSIIVSTVPSSFSETDFKPPFGGGINPFPSNESRDGVNIGFDYMPTIAPVLTSTDNSAMVSGATVNPNNLRGTTQMSNIISPIPEVDAPIPNASATDQSGTDQGFGYVPLSLKRIYSMFSKNRFRQPDGSIRLAVTPPPLDIPEASDLAQGDIVATPSDTANGSRTSTPGVGTAATYDVQLDDPKGTGFNNKVVPPVIQDKNGQTPSTILSSERPTYAPNENAFENYADSLDNNASSLQTTAPAIDPTTLTAQNNLFIPEPNNTLLTPTTHANLRLSTPMPSPSSHSTQAVRSPTVLPDSTKPIQQPSMLPSDSAPVSQQPFNLPKTPIASFHNTSLHNPTPKDNDTDTIAQMLLAPSPIQISTTPGPSSQILSTSSSQPPLTPSPLAPQPPSPLTPQPPSPLTPQMMLIPPLGSTTTLRPTWNSQSQQAPDEIHSGRPHDVVHSQYPLDNRDNPDSPDIPSHQSTSSTTTFSNVVPDPKADLISTESTPGPIAASTTLARTSVTDDLLDDSPEDTEEVSEPSLATSTQESEKSRVKVAEAMALEKLKDPGSNWVIKDVEYERDGTEKIHERNHEIHFQNEHNNAINNTTQTHSNDSEFAKGLKDGLKFEGILRTGFQVE